MNYRYIFFKLTLVFFLSCSGTSKKNEGKPSDKDFSWIENSDFKQPASVAYSSREDEYKQSVENEPLSRESLATLPESKLEDIEESSGKDISKMMAACYRKEFEKAFSIMDEVYRQYKDNPIYWNQVGSCYFLMGDNQKAKLFYNKSKSLKKDYAPPINNLGVYYQNLGFDQRALSAYKEAAKLNSFSLTPLYNISQLYLRYGIFKKAINGFKALNSKKKDDPEILNALATAYLIKGDFKRSISYFSKIDDSLFRKPKIGINLALALYLGGQKDEALKLVTHLKNEGLSDEYFKKIESYIVGR